MRNLILNLLFLLCVLHFFALPALSQNLKLVTPEWTWMGGSDMIAPAAIYGTQGTGSTANIPGARYRSISCADTSGNLWLFGGFGQDKNGSNGRLNDLWRYSPFTGEWAWMAGSDVAYQPGIYGSQDTSNSANIPGARSSSISWTDTLGNLWLFGGRGHDKNRLEGWLNDLWRYSSLTGEWTWMAGSDVIDQAGIYGTQGTGSTANIPGARFISISWTNISGNFWLFGGFGYGKNGSFGGLNDLWRYNPGTGEWTWMAGSDVIDQAGIYGSQGTGSTTNIPGARNSSISWTDTSGNLWLFGGIGYDKNDSVGSLNDLWRYNPATGEWTWMGGSDVIGLQAIYGTQGTGSTANIPGARSSSISWTDISGNFWLFGGFGYDKNGSFGGLNDLWWYSSLTGEWTWMAGSDVIDQAGIYGTQGTGSKTNIPGARYRSISWTDASGNFWLFGGFGQDKNGASGWLNDLWKIELIALTVTSLQDDLQKANKVYPNPATDWLKIRVFDKSAFNEGQVFIFNYSGQSMRVFHLKKIGENMELDLNIKHLPDGIYYYRLIGSDQSISGKFIKQ